MNRVEWRRADRDYWQLTDWEYIRYLGRLSAYCYRQSNMHGRRAARLGRIGMRLQLAVILLLLVTLLIRLLS
jgi:hypothetical protein